MNLYLKKFIDETFKKTGKALDLGAGDFFDVACMKQLGWKCKGVDKTKGTDLEKPYVSKKGLFDLVFSNYVIHKLNNKEQFLKTIFGNLKKDGWFFIHTFDASDPNSLSKITATDLKKKLKQQGFKNIKIDRFSYYDNDFGHKHWHKILQAVGQK